MASIGPSLPDPVDEIKRLTNEYSPKDDKTISRLANQLIRQIKVGTPTSLVGRINTELFKNINYLTQIFLARGLAKAPTGIKNLTLLSDLSKYSAIAANKEESLLQVLENAFNHGELQGQEHNEIVMYLFENAPSTSSIFPKDTGKGEIVEFMSRFHETARVGILKILINQGDSSTRGSINQDPTSTQDNFFVKNFHMLMRGLQPEVAASVINQGSETIKDRIKGIPSDERTREYVGKDQEGNKLFIYHGKSGEDYVNEARLYSYLPAFLCNFILSFPR
jgi:hypothetical protein